MLLSAFHSYGDDVTLKSGFANALVMDNLDEPTCLALGVDGRIFVTEKNGIVKVIENGNLLPNPFLELDVGDDGERGLGAICLHPDFEQNGWVYVYYTVKHADRNRLSRFTANGNIAIPTSELVIMDFDSLVGTIHNGGAMRFGPDGKLYIAVGDGSLGQNSQDMNSLLGKMLRLNPDGTIPADNPFYNTASGDLRAIYSIGLRNPFTFDLHKSTGQMLVNDVGLVTYEEINDILPGKNYGWPMIEGYQNGQAAPPDYQDPIYVYPHGFNIGCAVVGGAFYDPSTINFPSQYLDKYIFSDYCTGTFQVMDPSTGAIEDTLLQGAHYPSNIWVGEDGSLYYLSFQEGELWRLYYVGNGAPYVSQNPQDVTAVIGENASFHVEGGGDSTLTYTWYLNGNPAQTGAELQLNNVQLADSGAWVYCLISNFAGTAMSDTAMLHATSNQRPIPTMQSPLAGSLYSMGDLLLFSGSATDPEDGNIADASLEWKIDFHHGSHYHPGMPTTSGIASGSYPIPRIGETDTDVWFRVYLTATDSKGLSKTIERDIHPNLSNVLFASTPGNYQLELGGIPFQTPDSLLAVTGNTRILTAPTLNKRNDSLFRFVRWSHGETDNTISFNAGDQPAYTAEYEFLRSYFEGNGDGLTGTYFDNIDFSPPALFTQIVPEIDYFWDYRSPLGDSYLQGDSVSIRWTGSILAPITGVYTFALDYNEEAMLEINGELVVDGSQRGDQYKEGSIWLAGGQRYLLKLEYKELRWAARLKLFWSFVDQNWVIVPQKYLYSDTVPLEIPDPSEKYGIVLYPNPTDGTLNFLSRREPYPTDLQISDINGKVLREFKLPAGPLTTLDISDLLQGVYVARIVLDEKAIYRKFIKR